MKKLRLIGFISVLLIFLLVDGINAYDINPPNKTVHQHIANQSSYVWRLIPPEIKEHVKQPISSNLDLFPPCFDNSDDIIIGSGEEDTCYGVPSMHHFWQPDNISFYGGGPPYYDDGLDKFISSYRKALEIWDEKVVKNYIAGNINESYYWLGRVTHLLEDASQPSHIHLDAHPPHIFGVTLPGGDSVLEEYTGNNFPTLKSTYNWTGSNFAGQQYNYENLPNMQNFNWAEVEPTDPTSRKNIELFRLFWYTAQKTQYFASDDVDGNSVYYTTNNVQKSFPTDLWSGENVKFVTKASHLAQDDINDSGPNVSAEANAMIPHAMKAVVADIDGNEVMELRNISEGDAL